MSLRLPLVLAALGLIAPAASADTMLQFTETFKASGTYSAGGVGSGSFTNATFTLSATVDVTTAPPVDQGGGYYYYSLPSIMVSISGLGSGISMGSYTVEVVQSQSTPATSYAGFTLNNNVFMATESALFSTYTLSTPTAGPIPGTAYQTNTYPFTINQQGESVTINSESATSTFQASLAVPEPSSIALTAIAGIIGGLGAWRRRRAR